MGGSDLSLFFSTSLQSLLDIHSYFDRSAQGLSCGAPHLQGWMVFLHPSGHNSCYQQGDTLVYNHLSRILHKFSTNKVECQRNRDKHESKLVTRLKQDWRTNIHGSYFSGAEGRKTPPLLFSNDSWQVSHHPYQHTRTREQWSEESQGGSGGSQRGNPTACLKTPL